MADRVRGQWVELDEYAAVRGKECIIYLEPRGGTCDRGRFLAKLFADPGTALARELDDADGWPRYYFDEERAKLEVEAWLVRRGQLVEQTLEEATASVKERIAADERFIDTVLGALRGTA